MSGYRFLFSVLVLFSCFTLAGQGKSDSASPFIRIGWGDMMFEKSSWCTNSTTFNYKYTGHVFGEYQYPVLDWLNVGFKADWSAVYWDSRESWNTPMIDKNHFFTNICLMPELRFSYFRKGIVEMYSGFGYGLLFNTGTEVDFKNRTTACAGVFDLTAYGISLNYKQYFASFELGGLNSFVEIKKELYMLGSRLFSFSIGIKL